MNRKRWVKPAGYKLKKNVLTLEKNASKNGLTVAQQLTLSAITAQEGPDAVSVNARRDLFEALGRLDRYACGKLEDEGEPPKGLTVGRDSRRACLPADECMDFLYWFRGDETPGLPSVHFFGRRGRKSG